MLVLPAKVHKINEKSKSFSKIVLNDLSFYMLPTDFTKQEAVKQAEVLGVALSTMERWITKSVQTAHIERLATGLYRKKPSCIA